MTNTNKMCHDCGVWFVDTSGFTDSRELCHNCKELKAQANTNNYTGDMSGVKVSIPDEIMKPDKEWIDKFIDSFDRVVGYINAESISWKQFMAILWKCEEVIIAMDNLKERGER